MWNKTSMCRTEGYPIAQWLLTLSQIPKALMFTDTTLQSVERMRWRGIREGSCCSCARTGRTKSQKNLLAKIISAFTSDLQDDMGKTYFFKLSFVQNMGNTCNNLSQASSLSGGGEAFTVLKREVSCVHRRFINYRKWEWLTAPAW